MNWIIASSADPKKVSLFVRGLLLSLAPIAMLVFGLTEADVNGLLDAVVNVVFFALSLVAAGQVLWGLVRKVQLGRWSAQGK